MPKLRWVGRCGMLWVGEVENQQDFGVQVFLGCFVEFFFRFCFWFVGDLEKNMGQKKKSFKCYQKEMKWGF